MKTPAVLRITLALGARSRTSRLGATREAVLCSVRFNGSYFDLCRGPRSANRDRTHCNKTGPLFDHLVSAGEE
jgi:hypothetical protein